MGRVVYDVPLVTQVANPICWVACMAMVASERLGVSVGVGRYTNGFDPSNSSIANHALGRLRLTQQLMRQAGFTSVAIGASGNDVEDVLRAQGPFIFTHFCKGFPYGAGWSIRNRAPFTRWSSRVTILP
ncbi:MAG: papain-like cysteine protease family protein [Longimicrobiales bacterium]